MEKIIYELIAKAAELAEEENLLLNKILGIADIGQTVAELRRKSFTIVNTHSFSPTTEPPPAPMNAADTHLDNKIPKNLCQNGVKPSKLEGVTPMQKQLIWKNLTIKQRSTDGRWWARFRMYEKQYSVYGRTAEECLKNLKAHYKYMKENPPQSEAEENAEKMQYTTHEWLHFWRLTYKGNTDVINIETNIRLHIKPNLPDIPMDKVKVADLQNCINKIQSSRVRKYCYNIIRECWRRAFYDRIISWNPAEALPRVIHRQKKGKALTAEEEIKFFEKIRGEKGEKAFIFYILTGVRRSELLNINVTNIDRVNRLIHVKGTKTENAVRDVPLTELVEMLLNSVTPNDDGYYFRDYSADFYTRQIKNYVSEEHTLKDLRKTFITRASDAGIIMSATQVWAGHADIRTTGNFYNDAKQQAKLKTEHARLDNYYNNYFLELLKTECESDTHSDTQKSDK